MTVSRLWLADRHATSSRQPQVSIDCATSALTVDRWLYVDLCTRNLFCPVFRLDSDSEIIFAGLCLEYAINVKNVDAWLCWIWLVWINYKSMVLYGMIWWMKSLILIKWCLWWWYIMIYMMMIFNDLIVDVLWWWIKVDDLNYVIHMLCLYPRDDDLGWLFYELMI
jgi:hypothetical protein